MAPNGKGHNPSIATLQAQVEKLTEEVHQHNKELAVVKNDVGWMKQRLKSLDARTWSILAGIIISILLSVVIR